VHKIDRSLLEAVWLHAETRTVTKQGMVLAVDGTKTGAWQMIKMPELPNLAEGGRFRIDFWMKLRELSPGHTPWLWTAPSTMAARCATTAGDGSRNRSAM
jgi:hypothetical protein